MVMHYHRVLVSFVGLCLIFGVTIHSDAQLLQGNVSVDLSGLPVWNYTLTNLEPPSSDNWLTSLYLPVDAPISDIQSPLGWFVNTDYLTFVLWSNVEAFPYPDDIPPGGSVSGFAFTSNASSTTSVDYTLASWNHATDDPGPTIDATVLAPTSVASVVPEGNSLTLLYVVLLGVGLILRRQLR